MSAMATYTAKWQGNGDAPGCLLLIGSAVKTPGERQRVFESFRDFGRKPANLAFKTHGRQRSQPFNVGY